MPLDPRIYSDLASLIALKPFAQQLTFNSQYRPAGMLSGQHASRLRGSGLNFEELRQYHDGDNIRQIDSRTSARLGKPYVRVYSEETDRPVHIVVDQRNPMFFGSVNKTKSVVAAELASLLAWMANASGDRVGGIVVGEQIEQISVSRSKSGVLQLLDRIVATNQKLSIKLSAASEKKTLSLFNQVKPWLASLNSQSVVMLITDIEGLDSNDINEMELLHQQANILLFIVQDPLESDISNAQGLSVSEGEQQINIDAVPLAQTRFEQLYQKKLQRLRDALIGGPFPIGIVNTVEPVNLQLANLLQGHQ